MAHGFDLSLVRVECLNEQHLEWGKDEMQLFLAYGVSRRGTPYATGYRSIGSYGTDDVRTTPLLPMTLFEGELQSDGPDNVLLLWIVEQDSGGVRDEAAELNAQFLADFAKESAHLTEIGFPRECIPFTASYKAAAPLDARINQAATKRRNDELYSPPVDLFFRHQPSGPAAFQTTLERSFSRSKKLGHYNFFLRATWTEQPEILG
jgi:hypothetical protein